MNYRKIISLSIAISFIVLLSTGVLSYFKEYSRVVATLHTIFGLLFSLGIVFHLKNNFRSIKIYTKGKPIVLILFISFLFFIGASYQVTPFTELMDFGATQKAISKKELNLTSYQIVEMNMANDIQLTIDLLRSEHYWHPQMAVWLEDENSNYIETLFVSKATAKGLFFGGRSKDNFKNFDENKDASGDYRRVNALPVWSYKRDVQYPDGLYVPPSNNPLPDAITGATILDNFKLLSSVKNLSKFKLKIEINVAFDDNEYYSEYDFPEDGTFHNGTGQLGQPSIIFETFIDMNDDKKYYLMELIGHGHHSGQDGNVNSDLSTLTTAKRIVERIVVGVIQKP
ncbi:hypothetical protein [Aquimarina sp. Aq78]|uniref:hypothetical protein n=1 Tax=Aquimarina sp. Aq78 TaxID=1191889 RepID=UPI000D0E5838|nr:hypothetical protein [Aquimarina sp. Aq78]